MGSILALILAAATAAAAAPSGADLSPKAAAIAMAVRKGTEDPVLAGTPQDVLADLGRFYARRSYAPAWPANTAAAAEELIDALEEAPEEGLEPDEYRPAHLRALAATPQWTAQKELSL